tara:strand:+ start:1973 stop:2344 length:372 start_codon:yes stop_codon:yes gene_type:complete
MDATITVHRRVVGTPIEFRTNVLFASSFEKALQDCNGPELEKMIDKIKKLHDYVPESDDSFVSEPHVFAQRIGGGRTRWCVMRVCVTANQLGEELHWVPEPYFNLTEWTLDKSVAVKDLKLFT